MGGGKQLTESEQTIIHTLSARGISQREISEEVGRSLCAVQNVLKLGDNFGKIYGQKK